MENPRHFIIDLYDCSKTTLQDKEDIGRYLVNVTTFLGLKYIGDPNLTQFVGKHPDDNGITGSLILTTSLLSIHTYPREKACYIDLFACSNYDQGLFYDFTKRWFSSRVGHLNRVIRIPFKITNPIYHNDGLTDSD